MEETGDGTGSSYSLGINSDSTSYGRRFGNRIGRHENRSSEVIGRQAEQMFGAIGGGDRPSVPAPQPLLSSSGIFTQPPYIPPTRESSTRSPVDEARELIRRAHLRDPYSRWLIIIVIGERLPDYIRQQYPNETWATIDGDAAETLLRDASAYLGCARLVLRTPTVELLKAVVAELPEYNGIFDRVATFFMGHGADEKFFLDRNQSVNILDEIIIPCNLLSMQHLHFFDCCRVFNSDDYHVREAFSTSTVLGKNTVVVYATQPGSMALTGRNHLQNDDGVGVMTREFVELVKTHEGDLGTFISTLCKKTNDKLESLDPKLNANHPGAICHSTITEMPNFKEEIDSTKQPALYITPADDGYSLQPHIRHQRPPVNHERYYALESHTLQYKAPGSETWEYLETMEVQQAADRDDGGEELHYHHDSVALPIKLLGRGVEFRVLAKYRDDSEIQSDPCTVTLQIPPRVRPSLDITPADEGYSLQPHIRHQRPPVDHEQYYALESHTLQFKAPASETWEDLETMDAQQAADRDDGGEELYYRYTVAVPMNMLGREMEFRVLAKYRDDSVIHSGSCTLQLPPEAKPAVGEVKTTRFPLKNVSTKISWQHTKPPERSATGVTVHLPCFSRYEVHMAEKEREDRQAVEVRGIADQDERDRAHEDEPNLAVQIDDQGCTASVKLKPGKRYTLCVSAVFEGGQSVTSDPMDIKTPEPICTPGNACALIGILAILLLVAVCLVTIVKLQNAPTETVLTQLYKNAVIENSEQYSLWIRLRHSSVTMWECPDPDNNEQAYNTINAMTLPVRDEGKTTINMPRESILVTDTFAPDRYSLPHPDRPITNAKPRFMLVGSKVTFRTCLTFNEEVDSRSSDAPFRIGFFSTYKDVSKFIYGKDGEYTFLQPPFEFPSAQVGQENCKTYPFSVNAATYLFMAFETLGNVTVDMTIDVEQRVYKESDLVWKYEIREKPHTVEIPIPLWYATKILLQGINDDPYAGVTHVCSRLSTRRIGVPIVVGVVGGVGGLVLFLVGWCVAKCVRRYCRNRRTCSNRYDLLLNT